MDGEKAAKTMLQTFCSEQLDDHFFVDSLIAQFSNRTTSDFVAFLTKSTNKPAMKAICQKLSTVMDRCGKNDDTDELESSVVLLISMLASYPSLRLTTEESRQWVAFLTRDTIADDVSLKIALATIFAAPNLMQDQISFQLDEQIERSLGAFFRRLHSLIQQPEYALLSNVMILLYVHMITENADELANLLSTVLGHKVPKTLAKQSRVRDLYINYAFNEQDVVQKAAHINVTKSLNGSMTGYLPVHCICAMLHWRSFSKYSTPIQEWIKAQILECRPPIHPIMAHLLENFASSCIPTEAFPHFNQPIDETFFEEVFTGDIFDETRLYLRLLSLTFLVAFTYKLDIAVLPRDHLGTKRSPKAYSQRLWKSIPIRYLMIMADNRYQDFQHIRPMLQRYMVMSNPHLLPEQQHFDSFKPPLTRISTQGLPTSAEFSAALDEASSTQDFAHFYTMVDSLAEQPVQQQFLYYDAILKAMALSLDGHWPRPLLNKLTQIWERYDSVVPRRLHEDTIRLWLKSPEAASVAQLDMRDNEFLIAHTPLVLFRADNRVFRSPPHLRCFCRLLSFYLAASRDFNYLRLTKAAPYSVKHEMDEKGELLRSFIGTQRLAVVQVFIELCDGDPKEILELEEIRKILCAQIHKFFIADALLPKLVHFNMYPTRLIPVIVRGVPSAHVLINSVNDLITSGNLERRIFAIVLVSELLEQYKIPTAFAVLTMISDMLDTLISNMVDEEFIILALNTVPSLAKLVQLSPFHAEHFLVTMHRMQRLAQNRLSLYTTYIEARASPEQQLIELLDQTLKDLPHLPS